VTVAGVLALGSFAALLDTTVVGVAVHTLRQAFGVSVADVQWATTAYLLALSAVIPATGWAASRFGAAHAWVASLSVFLIGSTLCGFAWSLGSLIMFRVVQGLGAGMLFPLMRIIVVEVAGRQRLGRMMALIAIPIQLAPVVGPIVGGAAIEAASWRWAFFLNIPIVLATIVLSVVHIPNARQQERQRLDLIGLVTISVGLDLLIFALVQTGEGSIGSVGILISTIAAVLLLGAYLARQRRAAEPGIIELDLLRDRAFAASTSLAFLNNFGLFAAVFLVPLFLQQEGSENPLRAGLVLAPQGLGMLVAVLVVGKLIDIGRNARTLIVTGLVLALIGTVPFALQGDGGTLMYSGALFIRGVGLAFAVAPTMITLYQGLPASKVPAATTFNAVIQQIGAAAGTAFIAAVLQQLIGAHGVAEGFRWAFWLAIAFLLVSFVPVAFLPAGAAAPAKPDEAAREPSVGKVPAS
jgi:EmrB/QacA subfamily drug resistance transporter